LCKRNRPSRLNLVKSLMTSARVERKGTLNWFTAVCQHTSNQLHRNAKRSYGTNTAYKGETQEQKDPIIKRQWAGHSSFIMLVHSWNQIDWLFVLGLVDKQTKAQHLGTVVYTHSRVPVYSNWNNATPPIKCYEILIYGVSFKEENITLAKDVHGEHNSVRRTHLQTNITAVAHSRQIKLWEEQQSKNAAIIWCQIINKHRQGPQISALQSAVG